MIFDVSHNNLNLLNNLDKLVYPQNLNQFGNIRQANISGLDAGILNRRFRED